MFLEMNPLTISVGGNNPEWFKVDLGSDHNLDRVMIFPRTDRRQNSVRNLNIEVFDSSAVSVYSGSFLATIST